MVEHVQVEEHDKGRNNIYNGGDGRFGVALKDDAPSKQTRDFLHLDMSTRPRSRSTSPDPWPISNSILKRIAYAGSLDEISNHPEGLSHIVSSLSTPSRHHGNSRNDDYSSLTTVPLACTLYQTGRHGPQNGFRLVLVDAGVMPGPIIEGLNGLGDIHPDTAEMILCRTDTATIIADIPDEDEEDPQTPTQARSISYHRLIQPLLESEAITHIPTHKGEITLQLRKQACYPLSRGKKPGSTSQAASTGRGFLFRTSSSTPDGSGCRAVVLVKEGCSPEAVEMEVVALLRKRRRGEECFLVFCKEGLEKVYG